ncbi:MAG: DUF58 domain-containing protein [Proteobacteria bacterium]|nr:DUF58 domain-containing protein [Pseudomonadota bacterium]MBU1717029.1 DUF58 domain-containing protein [Pseudomonadota bacterium]
MSGFVRSSYKFVLSRFGIPEGFRVAGRISFVPTRNGYIFFVMLLGMLFGSMNHNNNLGFILTFLLVGMVVVSFIHTWRNLSGLTLLFIRATPVFAGQQAAFEILTSCLDHFRYRLEYNFPGGKTTIVDLARQETKNVTVFHDTDRRGLLTPEVVEISTSYPLGLFRLRKAFMVDGSCLVLPKPVAGPMITARRKGEERGEGESGGAGVEDFEGLATYQYGDCLQQISWKASARGQGLYTKKFEGRRGRLLFFSFDVMPGHDPELKLSRLCFMIIRAEALGLSYGLQIGEMVIEPGSGAGHQRRCLRELALVKI